MAGVVLYAYQQLFVDTSLLVPTVRISATQRTGGVAVNSHTTSDTPATDNKPSSATNSPTTPPNQSSSIQTAFDAAPKQAEIAATVTKEHPYYALVAPNDPYYTSVNYPPWALTHTGAPSVWSQSTGSEVVVAVLDTGFALQHEDLATQWYANPGENSMTQAGDRCWSGSSVNKSTNGCDDDNNGYKDDWRGWNFYGRYQPTATPCAYNGMGIYVANNNPQAGMSGDDILYQEDQTCFGINQGDPFAATSHGTSTAGLTGAASNNSKGIATFNWNVKVMPLQVLGDDGSGWTSKIVAGIYYAVDNGADIINMSLGGSAKDSAMEAAINYAYSHGVIVIAAAGNCGTGSENGCDPQKPGAMGYPALYNHVIAVGASDSNDSRASFSSYGPGLDIIAPGSGAIIAPLISRGATPNNPATFNYTTAYSGSLYGTSFAAPVVASMASLIKSIRPVTSPDDITAILDGSATKVGAMNGATYTNQYGHGLVNANTAAAIATSLNSTTPATPKLLQTGDSRSEHSYSPGATMSSGCVAAASTYCTIRLTNPLGYDRYLPYTLTSSTGNSGWQWSGNILQNGEWSTRAVQGDTRSGEYVLFSK
ncbi:MAG TPA: S8 family serine peptidase [Candidatus Saccharimonas sp.]|nr:S8 family serine peptidase [Candidatus Saccharimonas sp.]